MRSIDLNCDLGEGCGNDAELMSLISSANIACGFHAGDRTTMVRTVELAIENGVAIGAHPGYGDRNNFGRTSMLLSSEEVFDLVSEQISLLADVCRSLGTVVTHVKPHGALYNQSATDPDLATAIATALLEANDNLILFGLSGSHSISEAEKLGLRTASEVFADRTYRPDGSLTPRSETGALITNAEDSLRQVTQIIETGNVTATTGDVIPIRADTVCIHGDGEHAVEFARRLRGSLQDQRIRIEAVGPGR